MTRSTPVGPIGLLSAGATANIPSSGPVLLAAHGNAALLGHLDVALRGMTTTTTGGSTLQLTGATLSSSAAISLLAANAGPFVTGGAAIVNNTTEVIAALSHGNFAGAASLYFTSPLSFADAGYSAKRRSAFRSGAGQA